MSLSPDLVSILQVKSDIAFRSVKIHIDFDTIFEISVENSKVDVGNGYVDSYFHGAFDDIAGILQPLTCHVYKKSFPKPNLDEAV
jgi:hypothetical protein